MDNLHMSTLLIGAFQSCRNSLVLESPKARFSKSFEERAVMKFMAQLEAAYQYQLALKKSQRPKRKLPPVPKFEESETHSEPLKKVHISSENQPQVNALAKVSAVQSEASQESEDDCIIVDALSMSPETAESDSLSEKSDKTQIISQMDQMFDEKKVYEEENFEQAKSSQVIEKKDMKKFKKLEKCLIELIQKLNIKDASVPIYCKEYLELVLPHITEHFNKKPFIAIAAAILIFACYKASYPMTTKKILEASESKETLVGKCFYSIKYIITNGNC
eukprot:CAMPEP_0176435730 /NCGR_PEP_ID=MMETSP0127-20121128/17516_1 /TAXON_ID=938130 /ORGANISM="Platyophrya macrostoma, Strain WH" /LENGTH=275 /DNA_ID=CAMNT_0017818853 /DNA_START=55 /DNA_END=882 /DNA_ORIENTATION=+